VSITTEARRIANLRLVFLLDKFLSVSNSSVVLRRPSGTRQHDEVRIRSLSGIVFPREFTVGENTYLGRFGLDMG
jgi:hypothetical protein